MAEGTEWTLLELLCVGPLEGERRERFHQIITDGGVDYGSLLVHATTHRLANLVAYAFQDDELANAVPPQLRGELLGQLLANRRKVQALTEIAEEVVQTVAQAGIPVAATKGVVLEPTVYQGLGLRKMLDVDLVIHPDSRADVTRLMDGIGLVHGVYDWRTDRVEPLPAAVRAKYRLSPDHLPHYRRLDVHRGGVLTVDFTNSLTWSSSEWQLDMHEVLANPRTINTPGGQRLPSLAPAYLFLSVVLHLFRESWFIETIERGKDMLSKFADVARVWAAEAETLRVELPGIVDRYDLARPVAWTLVHTDRLLGTTMTEELGMGGAVSEEWLASARGKGGVELAWTGTMRERLRAHDRKALFPTLAAAG
jgi:hypothetical protein